MKNLLFAVIPQSGNTSGNIFFLLSTASPIVKFILILLLIFSVVSWAIIIFKLFEYSKAKKNSQKFIKYFRNTKNFAEIHKFAGIPRNNPLAQIFKNGYKEVSFQMGPSYSPDKLNPDSVHRALVIASSSEITRLEKFPGPSERLKKYAHTANPL